MFHAHRSPPAPEPLCPGRRCGQVRDVLPEPVQQDPGPGALRVVLRPGPAQGGLALRGPEDIGGSA